MEKMIILSVRAEATKDEVVSIVGDCPELGSWNPYRAVEMKRGVNSNGDIWSCKIEISGKSSVLYRYFVSTNNKSSSGERNLMIKSWETNLLPRKLNINGEQVKDTYGSYRGSTSVQKGWLTNQTEIHLRLWNDPIQMWKSGHNGDIRVYCKAFDLSDLLDTERYPVEISVYEEGKEKARVQDGGGQPISNNSFVTFKTQTFEPNNLGFVIEYFSMQKLVGTSHILPFNMDDCQSTKTTPILGMNKNLIGQLRYDYLKINPTPGLDHDMFASYAKYWNLNHRALDVGHRGMGNSYSTYKIDYVENTIASLSQAGFHGADMVEFDVQLSKDLIPVVYHDFETVLTIRRKQRKELEHLVTPVKDLNLDQLQKLKVKHMTERKDGIMMDDEESNDIPSSEMNPFPTLKDVLEKIDPDVAFYVEIKYPMSFADGSWEVEGERMERNVYIDKILEVVFKYAGNRRLLFASFCADVCTMVARKQNRYPTLYLIDNEVLDPMYNDPRCRAWDLAFNHPHAEDFLGVAIGSRWTLANMDALEDLKRRGLIIFVWGNEMASTEVQALFKQKGVHGLVYDRLSEFKVGGNMFKEKRLAEGGKK